MAKPIVNQQSADLKLIALSNYQLRGFKALKQRLRLARKQGHLFLASEGLSNLSPTNQYRMTVIIEQLDSGYQILCDLLSILSATH